MWFGVLFSVSVWAALNTHVAEHSPEDLCSPSFSMLHLSPSSQVSLHAGVTGPEKTAALILVHSFAVPRKHQDGSCFGSLSCWKFFGRLL